MLMKANWTTITQSQVRAQNSRQPSASSRIMLADWVPVARGTRIPPIMAAATKNVAASIAIPQPGPATATTTPPSAAPTIVVTLPPIRITTLAGRSMSAGTVCGTSAEVDGIVHAALAPLTTWRTASTAIRAWPVSSRAAVADSDTPASRPDPTITMCRGSRSAITPPSSKNATVETLRAASTMPRSRAE
jgi:hypothetical protein